MMSSRPPARAAQLNRGALGRDVDGAYRLDMGSWGSGLYQDDSAADLRNMIATLANLPATGDRILEIILDNWKEPVGLDADGGPTFWLVIADQFERRGIACSKVFEHALSAVDTGADLRDLEARGAEQRDLKKRAFTPEGRTP